MSVINPEKLTWMDHMHLTQGALRWNLQNTMRQAAVLSPKAKLTTRLHGRYLIGAKIYPRLWFLICEPMLLINHCLCGVLVLGATCEVILLLLFQSWKGHPLEASSKLWYTAVRIWCRISLLHFIFFISIRWANSQFLVVIEIQTIWFPQALVTVFH